VVQGDGDMKVQAGLGCSVQVNGDTQRIKTVQVGQAACRIRASTDRVRDHLFRSVSAKVNYHRVTGWLRASSLTMPMVGIFLLCAAGTLQARCMEDDADNARGNPPLVSDANTARISLQTMVREALKRSQAVGAARLLAEASISDVLEIKALGSPQASLSGSMAWVNNSSDESDSKTSGLSARAVLSVGAPLFDGGRLAGLTGWRKHLAEATKQGQFTAEEQVALQTVTLALERSRYRLQAQVYQQYARKISCLVDALEDVVTADKGRSSELIQAKKTLQQTELAQAQTVSMVRQIDTKLRRMVGDGLPSTEGMSSVLLAVPALDELAQQAERSSEVVSLLAQADAQDSYVRSVAANAKPQVNWSFSGSKAVGLGKSTGLSAGVNFNIPLINPSLEHSMSSARKRAQATRLQYEEALEARQYRIAEVHEQAGSSFDRARRVVEVVRNSDRVRRSTIQQWQQLGRRSLFDVMSAEGDHYSLRISYVNALYDGQQAVALLRSLGLGIRVWLE
jgi:outer membrane protein, adhesin transport system